LFLYERNVALVGFEFFVLKQDQFEPLEDVADGAVAEHALLAALQLFAQLDVVHLVFASQRVGLIQQLRLQFVHLLLQVLHGGRLLFLHVAAERDQLLTQLLHLVVHLEDDSGFVVDLLECRVEPLLHHRGFRLAGSVKVEVDVGEVDVLVNGVVGVGGVERVALGLEHVFTFHALLEVAREFLVHLRDHQLLLVQLVFKVNNATLFVLYQLIFLPFTFADFLEFQF